MDDKKKTPRARPALAKKSAMNGDVDNLRLALAGPGSRAAANATSPLGRVILCLACLAPKNAAECVRLLLEAGADPSRADDSAQAPLHWASRFGRAECARLLIAAGSDPNQRTGNGWTPLLLALYSNSVETIQALMDAGADPLAEGPEGQSMAQAARDFDPMAPMAPMDDKNKKKKFFMAAVANEFFRWEMQRDLAPGRKPRRTLAL